MTTPLNTPLVLIIRDGWGSNPNAEHDQFNAIKLAKTPVADMLESQWPTTLIRTSGKDVGLPLETMGNSEVGHQNIGAGRIVDQDSVRITRACRSGDLAKNSVLTDSILRAKQAGRYVHFMGICSDAGVHGLLEHLYALLDLCKLLEHERVALHLFTDGRDTGPYTGRQYIPQIQAKLAEFGFGQIASVIGRYWAMDRDNRWERVERAYVCLTGQGARKAELPVAATAAEAVEKSYENPASETMKGDEFVTPTMVGKDLNDALSTRITDGDTVIFYNYRGDRPRELCSAFVKPDFEGHVHPSPETGHSGFGRTKLLDLDFVMLTAYSQELLEYAKVAFPKPPRMVNIGGDYLAELGLRQFRCAETEKYPHVTFFFNDYRDTPFANESWEIVQSPNVNTYDLQPQMSAHEVRDVVLDRLGSLDCEDVIVVNFANGDMVGHTGNLQATIKAVEIVDQCVGAVCDATLARGGSLIITADHGNAEQMWDPASDAPFTAHTTYPVPLHVVGETLQNRQLAAGGRLADIMPTALDILGLEQPPEMSGQSLLA